MAIAKCVATHYGPCYDFPMPTSLNRREHMRRVHHLYQFVDNDGLCVYCGEIATQRDHFTPVSVMAVFERLRNVADGGFLLPCCGSCNRIASNKLFKTVGTKRRYIQQRLLEKYGDILRNAEWSDEDLDELGYTLRSHIEKHLKVRETIRRRIAWRNSENFAGAFIATIRLKHGVNGQGFVQINPVVSRITLSKEQKRSPSQLLAGINERRSRVNLQFLNLMITNFGETEALEIMRETKTSKNPS
jgi:hypothetical protein